MRRVFGDRQALNPDTGAQNPELARSWASMQRIMPNEVGATNRVRPMNLVERLITPGADAVTWPWGTIAVSPNIQGNELDRTLTHELTHMGQTGKGLGRYLRDQFSRSSDYLARPEEQEAFQAEEELFKKKHIRDIKLPNQSGRMQSVKPPKNAPMGITGTRG